MEGSGPASSPLKTRQPDVGQQIGPLFANRNRAGMDVAGSLESLDGTRNPLAPLGPDLSKATRFCHGRLCFPPQACRSATKCAPSMRTAAAGPNGASACSASATSSLSLALAEATPS